MIARISMVAVLLFCRATTTTFGFVTPHSRCRVSSRQQHVCATPTPTSSPTNQFPLAVARLQLIGCSALWGTYPSMLKLIYTSSGSEGIDASTVTVVRFGIMAAFGLSFLGIAKYPVFSNTKTLDFQATAPPSLSWSEQLEQRSPGSIAVCAAELGEYGDKLITTIK